MFLVNHAVEKESGSESMLGRRTSQMHEGTFLRLEVSPRALLDRELSERERVSRGVEDNKRGLLKFGSACEKPEPKTRTRGFLRALLPAAMRTAEQRRRDLDTRVAGQHDP
jgi:hypothetical protein